VIEETEASARASSELQNDLRENGEPLAARDAFIAGAAHSLGERLVVADDDFDVVSLTDAVPVGFL